jgi:hypothetical protein
MPPLTASGSRLPECELAVALAISQSPREPMHRAMLAPNPRGTLHAHLPHVLAISMRTPLLSANPQSLHSPAWPQGASCSRARGSLHRRILETLRRRLAGEGTWGGQQTAAIQRGVAEANALLLECTRELWITQRLLLGPFHPECAQTLHAIAGSIQALLTCAPQLCEPGSRASLSPGGLLWHHL